MRRHIIWGNEWVGVQSMIIKGEKQNYLCSLTIYVNNLGREGVAHFFELFKIFFMEVFEVKQKKNQ